MVVNIRSLNKDNRNFKSAPFNTQKTFLGNITANQSPLQSRLNKKIKKTEIKQIDPNQFDQNKFLTSSNGKLIPKLENYTAEYNEQGQIIKLIQKPKTYNDTIFEKNGKRRIETKTYIPHEIIFNTNGTIKKQIQRQDFVNFEKNEDNKSVITRTVFDKNIKNYNNKGKILTEKEQSITNHKSSKTREYYKPFTKETKDFTKLIQKKFTPRDNKNVSQQQSGKQFYKVTMPNGQVFQSSNRRWLENKFNQIQNKEIKNKTIKQQNIIKNEKIIFKPLEKKQSIFDPKQQIQTTTTRDTLQDLSLAEKNNIKGNVFWANLIGKNNQIFFENLEENTKKNLANNPIFQNFQNITDKLKIPFNTLENKFTGDSPAHQIGRGVTRGARTILIDYPIFLPMYSKAKFASETLLSGGRNLVQTGTGIQTALQTKPIEMLSELGTIFLGGPKLAQATRDASSKIKSGQTPIPDTGVFATTNIKLQYKKLRKNYVKQFGEKSQRVKDLDTAFNRAFKELPKNIPNIKEISVKNIESAKGLTKKQIKEADLIIQKYKPTISGTATFQPQTGKPAPRGKLGDLDVQSGKVQMLKDIQKAIDPNFKNTKLRQNPKKGTWHLTRNGQEFINMQKDTGMQLSELSHVRDPFDLTSPFVKTPSGVKILNLKDQTRIKFLRGFLKGKETITGKKTKLRPKDVKDVKGIVKQTQGAGFLKNKKGTKFHKTNNKPFPKEFLRPPTILYPEITNPKQTKIPIKNIYNPLIKKPRIQEYIDPKEPDKKINYIQYPSPNPDPDPYTDQNPDPDPDPYPDQNPNPYPYPYITPDQTRSTYQPIITTTPITPLTKIDKQTPKNTKNKINIKEKNKKVKSKKPIYYTSNGFIVEGQDYATEEEAISSGMHFTDKSKFNKFYIKNSNTNRSNIKKGIKYNTPNKFRKIGSTIIEKRNFRFDSKLERKNTQGMFSPINIIFSKK